MKGYTKRELNIRMLVASTMIAAGLVLAAHKIINFIQ